MPPRRLGWRLNHIAEMLARRADYTIGSHSLSAFDYVIPGSAIDGIAAFKTAAASWRKALTTADDGALDQVGRSDYPGRQRSGAALPGADLVGQPGGAAPRRRHHAAPRSLSRTVLSCGTEVTCVCVRESALHRHVIKAHDDRSPPGPAIADA
jgi:hypothetical protein